MALAAVDVCWHAIPDVRSTEQILADADIERECRDTPDKLERLRQDAAALCAEYFDRVRGLNNQPEPLCPGCEARALEQVDLVAQQTVGLVRSWLRDAEKKRRSRLRELALAAQGVLPLEAA